MPHRQEQGRNLAGRPGARRSKARRPHGTARDAARGLAAKPDRPGSSKPTRVRPNRSGAMTKPSPQSDLILSFAKTEYKLRPGPSTSSESVARQPGRIRVEQRGRVAA